MVTILKRHTQLYEATAGRVKFEKLIFSVGDGREKMGNFKLKTLHIR